MQPPKQTGRAHSSGRGVPLHVVLALCLAAFLAGRWLSCITAPTTGNSSSTTTTQPAAQDPDAWAQLQQSVLRPPLQPAASGNTQYTTLAPYQILSWYPRIVVFPNFIDDTRAQAIINLAAGQLQPSPVRVQGVVGEHNEQQGGRTSSGTFLTGDDDPSGALAWLERRIQDVTLLPASHGEKFYVIKYKEGERYEPHLDAFSEEEYGEQKSKRLATVVVYLSDVDKGGETLFPREGRDGDTKPVDKLPASCAASGGFKYTPRRGDAVLFYSLNPDGTLDPRSVHAGCPVGRGSEKWVVTKWIRDKPLVATGGFGWAD